MAAQSAALSQRFIFGINTHVHNNGSFIDDENIIYVAGHSLVVFNKKDRTQRFIQTSEVSELMMSYCAGPSSRLLVVSERGDRPLAHIYDTKTFRRKKTLTIMSRDVTNSKDYISMSMSQDEQMVLGLTSGPDFTLICWNWVKSKLVAFTKMSNQNAVYQCSISPVDFSVATVIGKEYVRFYRIGEKDIRALQEHYMAGVNFLSQCWMRGVDDHLLVGSECGQIHVFRSGEHIFKLACSPGPTFPLHSMMAMTFGFVCGTSDGSLLYIEYDSKRSDTVYYEDQFAIVNNLSHDLSRGHAQSLFLSPSEEQLGIVTSDGQILFAPATHVSKITTNQVKFAVCEFHASKALIGLDVCIKKPLFITCGKDNSVKLWNFQTHTVELQKQFAEDVSVVALHPNGLHCVIGTVDKLRFYHILVDDLRICLELPIKNCRECLFSKGGNYVAAANGSIISVFNFHTGEKVSDLRGHNGKVRSLYWLDTGCNLLSCGQDGTVYIWEMDGSKKCEYVQKGVLYTSSVCHLNTVYAVGSDRYIRQVTMPDLMSNPKFVDAGLILGHIALAPFKTTLLASTGDGRSLGGIRTYLSPPTSEFDEYFISSGLITRMKVTNDEGFVITTDDTGIITVFELKDKQDRFQRNSSTSATEYGVCEHWGDEILLTKAELEEKGNLIAELKTKVEELKLHNEYQLKLKEMNYSEKIKEVTEKFAQDVEQAKTKFELLREEKTDCEAEFDDRISNSEEKHQSVVQDKETRLQAEIMELVEAYQQLLKDRDVQIVRLEDQRKKMITAHERYVSELSFDFEKKLEEENKSRVILEAERGDVSKELAEIEDQLEDDLDTEIEHIKNNFELKLTESRETTLKYKGENGIMKKKFITVQRDIEEHKEELKMLEENEVALHAEIKTLEKDVTQQKKEIKVRDVTIGEKEKKIYELKKKNQELDKFKFVLDFKIRELKLQIEPKQNEIIEMRAKIKDIDLELEKYHKTNADLDIMIGSLRERIDAIQAETKLLRSNAKVIESKISRFRSDTQLAINSIQSPKDLKEAVSRLIKDHGSLGAIRPQLDVNVENEYSRHKDFLFKSVVILKKSLQENVVSHEQINADLLHSNMDLINRINTQRSKNRSLKLTVQANIGRIRHYAQQAMLTPSKKKQQQQLNDSNLDLSRGEEEEEDFTSMTLDKMAADTEELGEVDPIKVLDRHSERVIALKYVLADLEKRSNSSLSFVTSREMLPPMEYGDEEEAASFNQSINSNQNDTSILEEININNSFSLGLNDSFDTENIVLPPIKSAYNE